MTKSRAETQEQNVDASASEYRMTCMYPLHCEVDEDNCVATHGLFYESGWWYYLKIFLSSSTSYKTHKSRIAVSGEFALIAEIYKKYGSGDPVVVDGYSKSTTSHTYNAAIVDSNSGNITVDPQTAMVTASDQTGLIRYTVTNTETPGNGTMAVSIKDTVDFWCVGTLANRTLTKTNSLKTGIVAHVDWKSHIKEKVPKLPQ